ncbi:Conserved putative membrane protein [Candidatus Protochlamydia naegleriophila]|uniref:Conserved putative membrane protein n=1 Tax=Candidatus Protochlamydia naegleriophila TaxID=389348 RepID=A0A0U5K6N3_9BACT|nr:hypothetical protein [Candidatus Protochlamydia naegleriophila]CUI17819.1 Conserved putative membrane protein [Candidatus Protochlamydia naegleriophila]
MNTTWLKSGIVGIWLLLVSAHAPLFLTFDSLEQSSLEQEFPRVIHMRGFLYQTPSQSLVLAAQPDLKSCCIGTSSKVSEQIFVKGEIAKEALTHRAVTVQGVLKREPLFDARGELVQLYVLEQAILLSSKPFPLWTIVGVVLILALLGWLRYSGIFCFSKK